MTNAITPFLTFNGRAKEAMEFYAQALPDTKITTAEPYGDQVPWVTGDNQKRIMRGAIEVRGVEIMFLDMDSEHPAPEFNWASSILINCESEAEFMAVFNALKEGGTVMMGPEAVPPIRLCAWVVDKFGVVWQPIWM